MRFCRSSRATRVSPIAGSATRRSLDMWSFIRGLRTLGAEGAALEDGADAAAEVEDRAAAAETGGLVGEALEDEAAQGRVELREAGVADRTRLHSLAAGQLGLDQRVEQPGL